MVWAKLARYVLIAIATLVIGIAINLAVGNGLGNQTLFGPEFYLLLTAYGIFHVVALSVVRILSIVFSARVRSILYISVSIVGFLASLYFLSPSKYHGVHLFIICWASLVLIALDHNWRSNAEPE